MKRRSPNRKPRQLSLLTDDLVIYVGKRGWTLVFKETPDSQVKVTTGSIQEVYDALYDWSGECPDYHSAKIYRPSGARHRTLK